MQKIKFNETVENILIVFVGIVCVVIPALDFVGVFEHVEWVKARLPIFILLAVGILTTYLVSHLNNKEENAIERQKELLRNINNIKLDDSSAKFKELLENLWLKRERDIEKLFSFVSDQTKTGSPIDDVLRDQFEKMIGGNYFGAKVVLPWDFTL